jgi:diadenosine tetraphosphate (Ap4A) HIT family hydrolase
MSVADACPLCREDGGEILWQDEQCRLVLVADVDNPDNPSNPGSCRVIWQRHVAEMTDLDLTERQHLMAVVFAAEKALQPRQPRQRGAAPALARHPALARRPPFPQRRVGARLA